MRAAKTQNSLGIYPIWSESLLSAWRNLGSLATHWVQREDWSDWADAQADWSLRWAHRSFCWFCRAVAQISNTDKEVCCQGCLCFFLNFFLCFECLSASSVAASCFLFFSANVLKLEQKLKKRNVILKYLYFQCKYMYLILFSVFWHLSKRQWLICKANVKPFGHHSFLPMLHHKCCRFETFWSFRNINLTVDIYEYSAAKGP